MQMGIQEPQKRAGQQNQTEQLEVFQGSTLPYAENWNLPSATSPWSTSLKGTLNSLRKIHQGTPNILFGDTFCLGISCISLGFGVPPWTSDFGALSTGLSSKSRAPPGHWGCTLLTHPNSHNPRLSSLAYWETWGRGTIAFFFRTKRSKIQTNEKKKKEFGDVKVLSQSWIPKWNVTEFLNGKFQFQLQFFCWSVVSTENKYENKWKTLHSIESLHIQWYNKSTLWTGQFWCFLPLKSSGFISVS